MPYRHPNGKRCPLCGERKMRKAFNPCMFSPDGRANACKTCNKEWREIQGLPWSRRLPCPAACLASLNANQLELIDRSERRTELARMNGLKGVHAFKARLAMIRSVKVAARGRDIPSDVLDAILPV